mgnify:CR=1 FL=1|jgi:hypothetical protein|nr:MAG TPA: hypothetical protein [Caudoviricetes sp.]
MEETTVTEQSYDVHCYLITEYKCAKCSATFLDRDDNYAYCPYCGRKIVDEKE